MPKAIAAETIARPASKSSANRRPVIPQHEEASPAPTQLAREKKLWQARGHTGWSKSARPRLGGASWTEDADKVRLQAIAADWDRIFKNMNPQLECDAGDDITGEDMISDLQAGVSVGTSSGGGFADATVFKASLGGGGGALPVHRHIPALCLPASHWYPPRPGTSVILEAVRKKNRNIRGGGRHVDSQGLQHRAGEPRLRTAPAALPPLRLQEGDCDNMLDPLMYKDMSEPSDEAGSRQAWHPSSGSTALPAVQAATEEQAAATLRRASASSVSSSPRSPVTPGKKSLKTLNGDAEMERTESEMPQACDSELKESPKSRQSRRTSFEKSSARGSFRRKKTPQDISPASLTSVSSFAMSCRGKLSKRSTVAELPDDDFLQAQASAIAAEIQAEEEAKAAEKARRAVEERKRMEEAAALRKNACRMWKKSVIAASLFRNLGKADLPASIAEENDATITDAASPKNAKSPKRSMLDPANPKCAVSPRGSKEISEVDQELLRKFVSPAGSSLRGSADFTAKSPELALTTAQDESDVRLLASKHHLRADEVRVVQRVFREIGHEDTKTELPPSTAEFVLKRALGELYHNGDFQGEVSLTGEPMTLESIVEWIALHAFDVETLLPAEQKKVREVARRWKVNFTEVEDLHAKFTKFDDDESGAIDHSEFKQLLHCLFKFPAGVEFPQARVDFFWKEADINGNGSITFEEFFSWYRRYFSVGNQGSSTDNFLSYYAATYGM